MRYANVMADGLAIGHLRELVMLGHGGGLNCQIYVNDAKPNLQAIVTIKMGSLGTTSHQTSLSYVALAT